MIHFSGTDWIQNRGIVAWGDRFILSIDWLQRLWMTLPRSRTSKRGTWWLHEVFPQMLEKLKRAYKPCVCWLLDLDSNQGPKDYEPLQEIKPIVNQQVISVLQQCGSKCGSNFSSLRPSCRLFISNSNICFNKLKKYIHNVQQI